MMDRDREQGWLQREMKATSEEVKQWPAWMRREAGLEESRLSMTPSERNELRAAAEANDVFTANTSAGCVNISAAVLALITDLERVEAAEKRAAEAERILKTIHGLNKVDLAWLLDRWDQTEPALQRDITAAFAVRAMQAERDLQTEKGRRIYYQNIVYEVCNWLDVIFGNAPGHGIVCGNVESQTRNVQEALELLHDERETLRAERDEARRERDAAKVETELYRPGCTCAGEESPCEECNALGPTLAWQVQDNESEIRRLCEDSDLLQKHLKAERAAREKAEGERDAAREKVKMLADDIAELEASVAEGIGMNLCPVSYPHLAHDACDGKPAAYRQPLPVAQRNEEITEQDVAMLRLKAELMQERAAREKAEAERDASNNAAEIWKHNSEDAVEMWELLRGWAHAQECDRSWLLERTRELLDTKDSAPTRLATLERERDEWKAKAEAAERAMDVGGFNAFRDEVRRRETAEQAREAAEAKLLLSAQPNLAQHCYDMIDKAEAAEARYAELREAVWGLTPSVGK